MEFSCTIIFSSRCNHTRRSAHWVSWCEGWTHQPSHQPHLQSAWYPGPGEIRANLLWEWENDLWGWVLLITINPAILPEDEPSNWSLHPYLRQTCRGEIWTPVLGCWRRGRPQLTNRRWLLSQLHWIDQLWRTVFLCQLPTAVRHKVKY